MNTHTDPYELLTRQEAADALRVHISTLTNLTTSGALAVVKVGKRTLITRGALESYIRGERPDPLTADDTGLPGGTRSIFNRER